MKVPIGVGSLASWVSTSSARKSMYVANMPLEIAAMTDIMLMLEVAMENREAAGERRRQGKKGEGKSPKMWHRMWVP